MDGVGEFVLLIRKRASCVFLTISVSNPDVGSRSTSFCFPLLRGVRLNEPRFISPISNLDIFVVSPALNCLLRSWHAIYLSLCLKNTFIMPAVHQLSIIQNSWSQLVMRCRSNLLDFRVGLILPDGLSKGVLPRCSP